MKNRYFLLFWVIVLASTNQLKQCITHILHKVADQNFQCHHGQDPHFFSNYVLPDGADKCLQHMKGKLGFFGSTVVQMGQWKLTRQQLDEGKVTRQDILVRGWKCNIQGRLYNAKFKGIQLYISKCRHNQQPFQDTCIVKGWPILQLADDDL